MEFGIIITVEVSLVSSPLKGQSRIINFFICFCFHLSLLHCLCIYIYIYTYIYFHICIYQNPCICVSTRNSNPMIFFLFFLFVAYLACSSISNVFTALGFLHLVLVCHCWLFSKDALINLLGFSPLPGPKELPISFLDVWLVLSQLKTFSSVQFSSVTQSCLNLCYPMECCTPGFPVQH